MFSVDASGAKFQAEPEISSTRSEGSEEHVASSHPSRTAQQTIPNITYIFPPGVDVAILIAVARLLELKQEKITLQTEQIQSLQESLEQLKNLYAELNTAYYRLVQQSQQFKALLRNAQNDREVATALINAIKAENGLLEYRLECSAQRSNLADAQLAFKDDLIQKLTEQRIHLTQINNQQAAEIEQLRAQLSVALARPLPQQSETPSNSTAEPQLSTPPKAPLLRQPIAVRPAPGQQPLLPSISTLLQQQSPVQPLGWHSQNPNKSSSTVTPASLPMPSFKHSRTREPDQLPMPCPNVAKENDPTHDSHERKRHKKN